MRFREENIQMLKLLGDKCIYLEMGQMYPVELEIKDTSDTIGREGQLHNSIYDIVKRDDFNFHITNFRS